MRTLLERREVSLQFRVVREDLHPARIFRGTLATSATTPPRLSSRRRRLLEVRQ